MRALAIHFGDGLRVAKQTQQQAAIIETTFGKATLSDVLEAAQHAAAWTELSNTHQGLEHGRATVSCVMRLSAAKPYGAEEAGHDHNDSSLEEHGHEEHGHAAHEEQGHEEHGHAEHSSRGGKPFRVVAQAVGLIIATMINVFNNKQPPQAFYLPQSCTRHFAEFPSEPWLAAQVMRMRMRNMDMERSTDMTTRPAGESLRDVKGGERVRERDG